MKPIIKIKIYDQNKEKSGEFESITFAKLARELRTCDFDYGVLRVTYAPDEWNEATFTKIDQARKLSTLFREKSLLKFLDYGKKQ